MLQKLFSPKSFVVFAVILMSLVSVTYVSAHGGNTALIHACVSNSNGSGWVVSMAQNDLTPRLWSIQAFAICANVAP